MPTLIIGIGNPSRGDDALGPLMIDRLSRAALTDTTLLTDFQLQVEYVLDLHACDRVIFVDASMQASEPFDYFELGACRTGAYSTHAMPPEDLLHAYRLHYLQEPPKAHMLAIRGYRFELGEGLDLRAENNLSMAEKFLLEWLRMESCSVFAGKEKGASTYSMNGG